MSPRNDLLDQFAEARGSASLPGNPLPASQLPAKAFFQGQLNKKKQRKIILGGLFRSRRSELVQERKFRTKTTV